MPSGAVVFDRQRVCRVRLLDAASIARSRLAAACCGNGPPPRTPRCPAGPCCARSVRAPRSARSPDAVCGRLRAARRPRRRRSVRHRHAADLGELAAVHRHGRRRTETRRPTLEAFEKRTGISVDYVEEINDNDEFFGKISPALMNHQRTGRDLIVISDWMCARFVRLGWVQEMDRARQPNVTKYLDPLLRSPAFDPGRKSTVPWQSGITGIAYNRRRLGREIRQRVRPVGERPQGPGDPALRSGRGVRAADAGQRRGHHALDGGRLPHRSATRSRSRSARARSAASPATTTSRTCRAATFWPARPTPATSSSSRPTTPTSASSSPRRAPSCGRSP